MSNHEDWRRVRQQRSAPPGLAGEDEERRRVFQSALTQAEELWDAAATVGPASRPLPLFYCLSQAGRAVCAAWTSSEQWRPEAHGLKRRVSDDPSPWVRVFEHAARVNRPQAGLFSMVAAATESATFTGDSSVAELWTSLPGFPTPREHFGDRPRCLILERVNLPGDDRATFQRVVAPTHAAFKFTPPPIQQLPANYPSLRGLVQDGSRVHVFGGEQPLFKFQRDDGTPRPVNEVGTLVPDAVSSLGDRVVRPKIGEEAVGPPSEFLTLYALLYCLSELARYYPDTWVLALDPDESPAAVTLERGLDVALERAPEFINAALAGPLPRLLAAQLKRLQDEAADATESALGAGEDAGA